MFDYARNMQLALADTARRTAIKAGAGVVVALGAGFLLAALWSWLATDLGWGSTLASLTIGGVFVVLGLAALMLAGKVRHRAPSTEDLKREVEARLDLAREAAIIRARAEATRMVDMAENKVQSLIDHASYKASKVVGDAERSVYGFARDTARKAGLTTGNINAVRDAVDTVRDTTRATVDSVRGTARDAADTMQRAANTTAHRVEAAASTNAGSMAKILGAFAVGITLASKFQDWRRRDDDHLEDQDWDEDAYV